MSKREKVLASIVGGLLLVLVSGVGIKKYIFGSLERMDTDIQQRQQSLNRLADVLRRKQAAEKALTEYARGTFGESTDEAAARAGEHISALIAAAGLDDTLFTRTYGGSRPIRGRFANEITWNVQGQGPMKNVVDLIFLLEKDPHLHRVANLTARPLEGRTVSVQFRYMSLVLTRPLIAVERPELKVPGIHAETRAKYDAITRRDLFRPYIKKDAPPLRPMEPPPPPEPLGPGPETYRVVSLSQWEGKPEVLILDINLNKTKKYHVGDALAGGVLVEVDYRSLPAPRKPGLKSLSRVIIGSDGRFWAVENGDTLADKYLLSEDRLPPGLADES